MNESNVRRRPLSDSDVLLAQLEAEEYREEFESLEDALLYFLESRRETKA